MNVRHAAGDQRGRSHQSTPWKPLSNELDPMNGVDDYLTLAIRGIWVIIGVIGSNPANDPMHKAASAAGLPGLRGVEHIGFTVPGLEQAPRFFVDILGCRFGYSLGPI